MSQDLKDAVARMTALPDISQNDSERLRGFMRVTAVEIKAVGGVGAATSLEMIGYMRELERHLSSRDTETRQVLEGLHNGINDCWCPTEHQEDKHSDACLATQRLWEKLQPAKEETKDA